MSEREKAYTTIGLLHRDRLALEKFPRTPKIQAKIEKLRNLEESLKQAMRDPEFVWRLEQSAVRRAMKRSEKLGQDQSQKRAKRQTWNGLTRKQISARDQKILEHFKKECLDNRHLTQNDFSNRFAADHKLKPRQVRTILSKQLAANQVNCHKSA